MNGPPDGSNSWKDYLENQRAAEPAKTFVEAVQESRDAGTFKQPEETFAEMHARRTKEAEAAQPVAARGMPAGQEVEHAKGAAQTFEADARNADGAASRQAEQARRDAERVQRDQEAEAARRSERERQAQQAVEKYAAPGAPAPAGRGMDKEPG
ncbi:MAG: hypothetical protein ACRDD1_07095 [Planctomycetia bacterium]